MNDIYEEIEQIKADIEVRVKHPYLMKFIDVPVIDEQKLVLLYTILKEAKIPLNHDKLRQSIMATMLIQIALDTHELVGLHRIEDDNPFMKQRQLTVLAGDYYSGLYYYLLALIDDIPLLKILSIAIKEINEYKISVYQRDYSSIADYINGIAMIESLLVQKIAQYAGNLDMQEFSKQLLLVNRLHREKATFNLHGFSAIIDGMNSIGGRNALILVDNQIVKSIHYIDAFLQKHSRTYGFLGEKVMAFINDLDIAMEKVVKEG